MWFLLMIWKRPCGGGPNYKCMSTWGRKLFGKRLIWLVVTSIGVLFSACVAEKPEAGSVSVEKGWMKSTITITIVYDNNRYDSRLTTDWGFSCVVKSPQKTILFDTGGDGTILLHNMAKLEIDPKEIDVVVLSHIHGDHVGGLASFLERNSDGTVYIPISFPQNLKNEVRISGAKLEEVNKARELFSGVFTTGELDGGTKEQSILLMTPQGLVVITGCAHPGIVNIAKKAKEITGQKIFLMIGGFHLSGVSQSQVKYIAENLLQLGVERVAPCHCSGEVARKIFKDYFSENYIDSGVGKRIAIE
jgi:7,8-dihydropterin-6-yl-methyl-4-(beta-D-ribofuranosyl)aminobenzene 5'-phosphate synthase